VSGLLWPGDERAGPTFGDAAVVSAMLAVEAAWLGALVKTGVAPSSVDAERSVGAQPIGGSDLVALAEAAEAAGNPAVAFVSWLRQQVGGRDPDAARWLHRGLTSQDVVDTAVMLLAKQLQRDVRTEIGVQVGALEALAQRHRGTEMVGRTLTQPAVPITFGAKAASWLQGVLDAADDLAALSFPAQFGGAAGNRSGVTALGGDPSAVAACAAATLGLVERGPWHTDRAPITRVGAALVGCSAAWGRIANDVLTLSRPEIGELAEPAAEGRGGSSAMPQKVNPILSVLIRRAALSAPAYLSLLQLAAADAGDERPAGAWHLEWQPLALLARHTLTAACQASDAGGAAR
jgi:3-carboxy-cis,cis-muconate cycloisomerase